MNGRALVLLAVVAMSILGACSRDDPARPTPTDSPAPTPLAPDVVRPLDATGSSACSMLGPPDLNAIRLNPQTAVDGSNAIASACTWESSDGQESLTLVLNVNTSFELLYAARDSADAFVELTIRGHPAVRENPSDSAICTVHVALAPTQLFSAEFSTSATDRPVRSCESAESAAGAVVDAIAARG